MRAAGEETDPKFVPSNGLRHRHHKVWGIGFHTFNNLVPFDSKQGKRGN